MDGGCLRRVGAASAEAVFAVELLTLGSCLSQVFRSEHLLVVVHRASGCADDGGDGTSLQAGRRQYPGRQVVVPTTPPNIAYGRCEALRTCTSVAYEQLSQVLGP